MINTQHRGGEKCVGRTDPKWRRYIRSRDEAAPDVYVPEVDGVIGSDSEKVWGRRDKQTDKNDEEGDR